MSKHTPGSWYVDGTSVFKDIKDKRFKIAELSNWGDETKANADLIASSPDLLNALINILEYWNRDQGEEAMLNALEYITQVSATAIAKARGEA